MDIDASRSVVAALLALVCAAAPAQQYPAKPIRLIVPLAPGGPSDILARTVAQKLTEGMKQTVVVDNRTGAGGTVGAAIAAKSPPDGYTIILVSTSYAINATLYPKLPYDTLTDLAAVTMLAAAPYLLTVHPSLPAKSFKQLVALAKARPGDLNYASGGSGTGPQLSMEVLKQRAGLDIVHVPYKGAGPALTDLVAGQVHMQMVNMIAGLPLVKAGRIRAVGVSKAKRSEAAPDIPTIAESGVPGFDEGGQHGIMIPAGTPRDIIARLHREIVKVLQSPDIKGRLAGEGAAVIGNTPEEYAAIVRADVDKWAKVIKNLGLRAN
ncbi:MAG: tripartite tricarboxylate transporter substrate binding protein [Betaproteobacteria bacterium]|nr:tripartite tricarboxylate transporter substrate binding protein [Betaproteobacteria bacterium]